MAPAKNYLYYYKWVRMEEFKARLRAYAPTCPYLYVYSRYKIRVAKVLQAYTSLGRIARPRPTASRPVQSFPSRLRCVAKVLAAYFPEPVKSWLAHASEALQFHSNVWLDRVRASHARSRVVPFAEREMPWMGGSHWPMLDDAAQFNWVLADFLAATDGDIGRAG